MTVTRAVWLIAIIAVLFIAFQVVRPHHHTIYEDDPRWDCATMGNKICGR